MLGLPWLGELTFQCLSDWIAEGTSPVKDDEGSEPGKRQAQRAINRSVERSFAFSLLRFTGSFSGPHVDYLNGTWLRCVSGVKAWIVAVGLTQKDYGQFANQSWCPEGRTRIIVLEAGDVLWMPPCVLIVHSPVIVQT